MTKPQTRHVRRVCSVGKQKVLFVLLANRGRVPLRGKRNFLSRGESFGQASRSHAALAKLTAFRAPPAPVRSASFRRVTQGHRRLLLRAPRLAIPPLAERYGRDGQHRARPQRRRPHPPETWSSSWGGRSSSVRPGRRSTAGRSLPLLPTLRGEGRRCGQPWRPPAPPFRASCRDGRPVRACSASETRRPRSRSRAPRTAPFSPRAQAHAGTPAPRQRRGESGERAGRSPPPGWAALSGAAWPKGNPN